MSFPADTEWLTLPDIAERWDVKPTQVRRLIEERMLVAARIDGVLRVPALFLEQGQPLKELHGTIVVLGDAGYDDEGIVRWMLEPEDSLGVAPIEALRAGRKAEVRRVAQALGF